MDGDQAAAKQIEGNMNLDDEVEQNGFDEAEADLVDDIQGRDVSSRSSDAVGREVTEMDLLFQSHVGFEEELCSG